MTNQPSAKGNVVLYYAPELETKTVRTCDNLTIEFKFGSVELDMTNWLRIERNDKGEPTKIEKFNHAGRITIEYNEQPTKKWWQIWK